MEHRSGAHLVSFMPPTHFGMLASMSGGRDACAIFVTATVTYGHMAPATTALHGLGHENRVIRMFCTARVTCRLCLPSDVCPLRVRQVRDSVMVGSMQSQDTLHSTLHAAADKQSFAWLKSSEVGSDWTCAQLRREHVQCRG